MELIIIRDAREVGRHRLSEGIFSLGRGLHNTIALNDQGISRRHARIRVEDGRVIAQDLASANGTFLRGEAIREADLQDGDVLEIGPFHVRVHFGEEDFINHDPQDRTESRLDLNSLRAGSQSGSQSGSHSGPSHESDESTRSSIPAQRSRRPRQDPLEITLNGSLRGSGTGRVAGSSPASRPSASPSHPPGAVRAHASGLMGGEVSFHSATAAEEDGSDWMEPHDLFGLSDDDGWLHGHLAPQPPGGLDAVPASFDSSPTEETRIQTLPGWVPASSRTDAPSGSAVTPPWELDAGAARAAHASAAGSGELRSSSGAAHSTASSAGHSALAELEASDADLEDLEDAPGRRGAAARHAPRLPNTFNLSHDGSAIVDGQARHLEAVAGHPDTLTDPSSARLVLRAGRAVRDLFELSRGTSFIGRAEEMEIVLLDTNTSRRHAAISWEDDGFVVRDLWSLNGIRVNGERAGSARLRSGDRIQVGDTVLEFVWPGQPALEHVDESTLVAPSAAASSANGNGAGEAGAAARPLSGAATVANLRPLSPASAQAGAAADSAARTVPVAAPHGASTRPPRARSANPPGALAAVLVGAILLAVAGAVLFRHGRSELVNSPDTKASVPASSQASSQVVPSAPVAVQPEAGAMGAAEPPAGATGSAPAVPSAATTGAATNGAATTAPTTTAPTTTAAAAGAVTAGGPTPGNASGVATGSASGPAKLPSSSTTAPVGTSSSVPAAPRAHVPVTLPTAPAIVPATVSASARAGSSSARVTGPGATAARPATPAAPPPLAKTAALPDAAAPEKSIRSAGSSPTTSESRSPETSAQVQKVATTARSSAVDGFVPRTDLDRKVHKLYQTGLAAQNQGRYLEALRSFEKALNEDPYKESELYYQVEDEIRVAKTRLEDLARPLLTEALALIDKGRLVEARQKLAEAVNRDPGYAQASSKLRTVETELARQASQLLATATAREETGATAEAEQLYRQVLTLVPDPSNSAHQRAEARLERLKQGR